MLSPMPTEAWAARLRTIARVGMRHRVTLQRQVRLRQPNGETELAWQDGTEQAGLLMMGGATAKVIAAARGVEGTGTLRLALGTIATAGQRARVVGTTRGVAWTRTVALTSSEDETNRLFALATVIDVVLNR